MGGVEYPILIPVPGVGEGVGCKAENEFMLGLCEWAAPLFVAARGGGVDVGLGVDH